MAARYGIGTKDACVGCAVATVIPVFLDTVSGEEQIWNYRVPYGEAAIACKVGRIGIIGKGASLHVVPVEDIVEMWILASQKANYGIGLLFKMVGVTQCLRDRYICALHQIPALRGPTGVGHAVLLKAESWSPSRDI